MRLLAVLKLLVSGFLGKVRKDAPMSRGCVSEFSPPWWHLLGRVEIPMGSTPMGPLLTIEKVSEHSEPCIHRGGFYTIRIFRLEQQQKIKK